MSTHLRVTALEAIPAGSVADVDPATATITLDSDAPHRRLITRLRVRTVVDLFRAAPDLSIGTDSLHFDGHDYYDLARLLGLIGVPREFTGPSRTPGVRQRYTRDSYAHGILGDLYSLHEIDAGKLDDHPAHRDTRRDSLEHSIDVAIIELAAAVHGD
jgi:hypothetical protein